MIGSGWIRAELVGVVITAELSSMSPVTGFTCPSDSLARDSFHFARAGNSEDNPHKKKHAIEGNTHTYITFTNILKHHELIVEIPAAT
jgi:hypothetical protein